MPNHRHDVSGDYGPAHPRQGPVGGQEEEVAWGAAATTTAHGPATEGGPLDGAALQHVAADEAKEASAIYQLVAAEFPMGISSPLRKGQSQQTAVASALGRFAVPLALPETPSGMADLAAESSPVLPVQGDAPRGDSGCSKLYDPAAGSIFSASGGTPEISNHPASPVAALAANKAIYGTAKPSRQARDPDGRHCRIYVRVTEEERARIEARAAASGVTAPRLLVELALLGPAGATERHAVNAAMLGMRRQIVGMATNINQLAKWANTREQLPPGLDAALASIRRMDAHVAAVLDAMAAHVSSERRGRKRGGERPPTSRDG
jgi:hypothetical protein